MNTTQIRTVNVYVHRFSQTYLFYSPTPGAIIDGATLGFNVPSALITRADINGQQSMFTSALVPQM